MTRRARWVPFVVGALVAAGCSSEEPEATAPVPTTEAPAGDSSAPDTDADSDEVSPETDPPSTEPAETPETEPPGTEPPATTETPETTTTIPARRLADDIGPMSTEPPFDDIPLTPVPGEYYEIAEMSYLYLPFERDPDDGSIQPPSPEDYEILEAYARAEAAWLEQLTSNPVAGELSGDVLAAFGGGALATLEDSRNQIASDGLHIQFPEGRPTVHRPVVLDSSTTDVEAVILNCTSTSGSLVDASGVPVEDTTPYAEIGLEVTLERVDGIWIVTNRQLSDLPCVL